MLRHRVQTMRSMAQQQVIIYGNASSWQRPSERTNERGHRQTSQCNDTSRHQHFNQLISMSNHEHQHTSAVSPLTSSNAPTHQLTNSPTHQLTNSPTHQQPTHQLTGTDGFHQLLPPAHRQHQQQQINASNFGLIHSVTAPLRHFVHQRFVHQHFNASTPQRFINSSTVINHNPQQTTLQH